MQMIQRLVVFLLQMSLCAVALAMDSGGAVGGTVVNSASATPIPNARVIVLKADSIVAQGTTNEIGKYRIKGIPRGFYTVKVDADGFDMAVREAVEVNSRFTTFLDFELALNASPANFNASMPDSAVKVKPDLMNFPCDSRKIRLAGEHFEAAGKRRTNSITTWLVAGAIGGTLILQGGSDGSRQAVGAGVFALGTVVSIGMNLTAINRERNGGRLLRDACP